MYYLTKVNELLLCSLEEAYVRHEVEILSCLFGIVDFFDAVYVAVCKSCKNMGL